MSERSERTDRQGAGARGGDERQRGGTVSRLRFRSELVGDAVRGRRAAELEVTA